MTIYFSLKYFIIVFVIVSAFCMFVIRKNTYRVVGICFALYLTWLIKTVFFPVFLPSQEQLQNFKNAIGGEISMIQYIPFKNILLTFQSSNWLIQIGGNIVLLMPLVVFIGLFMDYKKIYSVKKILITGIGTSILIEVVQAIMNYFIQYPNRIADIDDIILNSLGVIIVSVVYEMIRKQYLKKYQVKR